jgi:1-acyl-sn-glycerol-3-phosphate acyltransferase
MARQRLGFWYRFAIAVVKPVMILVSRRDWPAGHPLPEGGIVVVPNHLSHVDPFVVGHYLYNQGRPPRFLAKASLFSTFLVGTIVRHAGQIPVYRETRDASVALRDAIAAVRRGECVVVYAEGTLTRDPELWPMVGKTGAARIAFASGRPVVPVAMWGPQDLLLPYSRRPHLWPRPTMRVRVGAPVELADLLPPGTDPNAVPGDVLRLATERIMAGITALVAGMRGEPAPAVRFDPRREGLPTIGDPGLRYERGDRRPRRTLGHDQDDEGMS